MTDPKHIVFHASAVLTSTYSFSLEQAGLPGFHEGKAILHVGRTQVSAVAQARGAERAVAMAVIKAAEEVLRLYPPTGGEVHDGDGDAD